VRAGEVPGRAPAAPALGSEDTPEPLALEHHVDALERRLIANALARTNGNRSQAARMLGISRNGLAIKIGRLGLNAPEPGTSP
jgi:DNA-binding NtrC family response regulator